MSALTLSAFLPRCGLRSLWREKCLNAKPFLKDQLVRVSEEKKASWRTLYRCIAYPHRVRHPSS